MQACGSVHLLGLAPVHIEVTVALHCGQPVVQPATSLAAKEWYVSANIAHTSAVNRQPDQALTHTETHIHTRTYTHKLITE